MHLLQTCRAKRSPLRFHSVFVKELHETFMTVKNPCSANVPYWAPTMDIGKQQWMERAEMQFMTIRDEENTD